MNNLTTEGSADLDTYLGKLFHLMFRFKCRRAAKALAGKTGGCLLINGRSLFNIYTCGKYSDEDIRSLSRHMKENRPHLAAVLESHQKDVVYVIDTGRIPDGMALDKFCERVKEALAADQEEAAWDNCVWASME
ncbi:hypothetical protein KXW53_002194 [Aspergillus fumigatus]|nr:hypothetical protein KXX47_007709 [Aspergillus fumigatus]KAH1404466.1 hypothetical protein KXX22_001906 [Aspergillus fumigatus]KAH1970007.1 hypothetical protein KXV80_000960 [Aspergillus fumigatus]KAH2240298.1 hypothetical protein KXW14_008903 [Aspergillus fumigatus]KAH2670823.1 hypothetical protein KXV96_002897 [Aspergillus fumigatus]